MVQDVKQTFGLSGLVVRFAAPRIPFCVSVEIREQTITVISLHWITRAATHTLNSNQAGLLFILKIHYLHFCKEWFLCNIKAKMFLCIFASIYAPPWFKSGVQSTISEIKEESTTFLYFSVHSYSFLKGVWSLTQPSCCAKPFTVSLPWSFQCPFLLVCGLVRAWGVCRSAILREPCTEALLC